MIIMDGNEMFCTGTDGFFVVSPSITVDFELLTKNVTN